MHKISRAMQRLIGLRRHLSSPVRCTFCDKGRTRSDEWVQSSARQRGHSPQKAMMAVQLKERRLNMFSPRVGSPFPLLKDTKTSTQERCVSGVQRSEQEKVAQILPHTFCWRPGNGERVRMHVLLPKLTVNHDRRCRRYNSPSQHQHPSHSLHVFACRAPAVGLSQAHRGRIFQTYRDRVDSVRDNVARTGTSPGKCCTSTGS